MSPGISRLAIALLALAATSAAGPIRAQASPNGANTTPPASIADLEKGCRKKDAESCHGLANRLLEGAAPAETRQRAVDLLLEACTLMSAPACGKAAARLAAVEPGMTPDWPRIAKLLDRGCGLQDPWSCQTGASLYYTGSPGVPSDPSRARSMFTAGCGGPGTLTAKSCRFAGTMYVSGQGGEKSEAIAKLMFKRGCDKQDAPSCKVLNLPPPE